MREFATGEDCCAEPWRQLDDRRSDPSVSNGGMFSQPLRCEIAAANWLEQEGRRASGSVTRRPEFLRRHADPARCYRLCAPRRPSRYRGQGGRTGRSSALSGGRAACRSWASSRPASGRETRKHALGCAPVVSNAFPSQALWFSSDLYAYRVPVLYCRVENTKVT